MKNNEDAHRKLDFRELIPLIAVKPIVRKKPQAEMTKTNGRHAVGKFENRHRLK